MDRIKRLARRIDGNAPIRLRQGHRQIVAIGAVSAFALVVAAMPGLPFASDCPSAEAMLSELNGLTSWKDLHSSFERFKGKGCDDGTLAEGYSDFVVRRLGIQWNALGELQSFADSDRGFEAFVLSHIDATADPKDLEKVAVNSSSKSQAVAAPCVRRSNAQRETHRR